MSTSFQLITEHTLKQDIVFCILFMQNRPYERNIAQRWVFCETGALPQPSGGAKRLEGRQAGRRMAPRKRPAAAPPRKKPATKRRTAWEAGVGVELQDLSCPTN